MTKEQYNAVINAYPKAEVIYQIVYKFKEIRKADDPEKWIEWMNEVEDLKIEEMNTFINGLRADLAAAKNAIALNYSNGLAEGSVNKLKVIKRMMYGRCSFDLLRKKTLQLEHLKQFN